MAIKELKDFINKNYFRRVQFPKEDLYYSIKYQKEANCD